MTKKQSKEKKNNLSLAVIFLGIVVFLILFSLVVRTFIVFKNSKFDGKSPLSIKIEAGEESGVLTLSPEGKKVSFIKVEGEVGDVSEFLGIGSEAEIRSDSFSFSSEIKEEILSLLLDYNGLESDMNIFDRVRVVFFVKSTSADNTEETTISSSLASNEVDRVASGMVTDKKMKDEGLSIEVRNASGIDGLGTKIARVINNSGGNVILVSSSEKISDDSVIEYVLKESYTVKRLSKVFRIATSDKKKGSIADILLVLGRDREE